MAGNDVQLPQDLMKIEVMLEYNPDLLRKTLSDILIKIGTLEDSVEDLTARVEELENA